MHQVAVFGYSLLLRCPTSNIQDRSGLALETSTMDTQTRSPLEAMYTVRLYHGAQFCPNQTPIVQCSARSAAAG
jgi:hypothetical protein